MAVLAALIGRLRADDSMQHTIPENQWITWAAAAMVDVNFEVSIFMACLDSSKSYSVTLNGGTVVSGQSGNISRNASYVLPQSIQAHGNFPSGTQPVNLNITHVFRLLQGSTVVDTQTVTYNISGMVKHTGSTAMRWPVPFKVVISLKPGGPAQGKTRVGQVLAMEAPPAPSTVDLIYHAPDSYSSPETGAVTPLAPPAVQVGGKSFSLRPGIGWNRFNVQASEIPSSGAPSWLASPLPRIVPLTGGDPAKKIFFGTRSTGGPSGELQSGTISKGADGSTNVQLFTGDGLIGYAFPSGHQAMVLDAVPAQENPISSLNVDPCFAGALDILGQLPPGMGPDDGSNPLPPGVQPDPGGLNPPPGLLPGDGSNPLPPGVYPGVPGAGGGGGSAVLPPGVSPGGGVTLPGLPGGGGEGQGPAVPGGPLPEDGAGDSNARGLGKKTRDALSDVQDKAKGFMDWGRINPFSTGEEGQWIVTLNIAGTTHNMEIPTEHAPVVRSLFKLLLGAVFLIAIVKLLLS